MAGADCKGIEQCDQRQIEDSCDGCPNQGVQTLKCYDHMAHHCFWLWNFVKVGIVPPMTLLEMEGVGEIAKLEPPRGNA